MADAQATPILVLGDTRRNRLQSRVCELLEQWYRKWAAGKPPGIEVSERESGLRGELWTFIAARGTETLLKVSLPGDVVRVLSAVRATAATSPLTTLLTDQIATDLCTHITAAALPAAAVSVRRVGGTSPIAGVVALSWTRPGSMKQTLTASTCSENPQTFLELTLTPTIIDALLAARPVLDDAESLMDLREASRPQPVRLSAVLGTAQVSWSDLQALCVGDVIVLEQYLSAPCTLHVGPDMPVADAQLGRIGNSFAAQISRLHT